MQETWARTRWRKILCAGAAASGLRLALGLGVVAGAALLARPAAAQVESPRYSSIIVDANSGRILEATSADSLRHPASLTKMMTLYMLFEALRDHRVSLDQMVPVSPHAASMPASKLGLLPGMRLTVEEAILALVTKSANDAAAALGELMGGDERRFGEMMTLRAHALGMTQTNFRNASGLPDPDQVTTARDLSTLVRHLIQDFPDEYHYFSTPGFVWHGMTIPNHDTMIRTYPGADGLKTGYIQSAGFNLATSAVQGGVRLIGIVLGAGSPGERVAEMRALLNHGFEAEGVAPAAPVLVARSEPRPASRGRLRWLISNADAATLEPHLRAVSHRGLGRRHMTMEELPRRAGGVAVRRAIYLAPHAGFHRAQPHEAGRRTAIHESAAAAHARHQAGPVHQAGCTVHGRALPHCSSRRSTAAG